MRSRYSKQELFRPIGRKGQERIRKARILVIGAGALGSFSLELLTRAGAGFIRVIDRDIVELDNIQRQALYCEQDARDRTPKVFAAQARLRGVNSDVLIDPIFDDLTASNAETLVKDVDLVLDCTDNFEARFLINDACVKLAKPWLYAACLGSYGMQMTFLPGGVCFRCLMEDVPEPGSAGTCDTAGVIGSIVGIISSFQVSEGLKLICSDTAGLNRRLLVIDCWRNDIKYIEVTKARRCPACVMRRFEFLGMAKTSMAVKLCGRDSVYITPARRRTVRLDALRDKLSRVGEASLTGYALIFREGDIELNCFADGRAIIKGTEDVKRARAVYSKYIGS